MVSDPIDYAMVKSIHEIGRVTGMKTIAEFVENDAIRDKLLEIGVDFAQGYGVSMPMDIVELVYNYQQFGRTHNIPQESSASLQVRDSFIKS